MKIAHLYGGLFFMAEGIRTRREKAEGFRKKQKFTFQLNALCDFIEKLKNQ